MTTSTPNSRRWLVGAALAATFVMGGFTLPTLTASAQDAAMQMHGGGHGDVHAMMWHLEKMLSAVDATPDQKSRITAILGGAMPAMGAAHARAHESMKSFHALLTAPTIDRGALESLRASEVADIDVSSKTLVAALADTAEVLSPQQRAKLSAMMMEHGHPR